ncbi:protein PLANT CADMIUM RESISTANCE 2-like [Corylus avellana]|uniref:protein PLANT CADMIUM RESISTANCE 2-like n=1 Tax=Corylus avellana TaxID=13451 RepID=UPI00286B8B03|nr:protein PLANT CADMIUM RESISTANCE 2-like [Corylus avellana]XP_059447394.1 protein PLANT CADMIUM RESISTANCE 2-like [Corylus avellana]
MYSSQPNTYEKYSDGQPVSSDSAATGVPYDPSLSQPSAFSIDKPKPRVPWTTGLFDCFSDMKTCCITCWCPCITFGQIAEIVDKGGSSCGASGALYTLIACVIGCPCFYSCFYRSKMRQQYMLEESFCGDCMIHCLCEGCALCQEHRELQNRGYDMSIGWHGNVERRNKEAMMGRPVVEGSMSR